MARKDLVEEIRKLDERLGVERSLLKLDGRDYVASLKNRSPYWLIGGGFVMGLVAGQMGHMARAGLFSLGMEGARVWRLAQLWMPGAGEAPPDVDA
ncbi:hypothetical protein [Pseudomonas sp.]|jgi:hypothetical protein|uniref:hypothetical protein n=1 Tax=Pseudomonas sp. TaxID=306 RepID=UPI00272D0D53|nr:hypothetical protein [Pseudomonas sp.]